MYSIEFDFSLPENHSVQPGDYYAFTVPTAFKLDTVSNIDIVSSNGEVFAKYSIDATGNVTIEFTDAVRNEAGEARPINDGKFFQAWALADSVKTGALTKDYPFDINGQKTFTISIPNSGGKEIEKSNGTHDKNATTVKWHVDVNTKLKTLLGSN